MHEQDGFFRSGGACAELGGTGFPTSQFTNDTSGYSKGSLTGSAVTVSGSSTKIYKGYYYDVKGRVTKVVQNNLLGGYDVTNTVYAFTGQPATVTHSHTASGKSTRTEVYTYSYDHADRVSKVEHTLGGTKITLADYTYDSFGRLSTKSLHGSAANKLTYAYNLRSWLTGITSTRFTQNLYYNTGVGTARYNGSISSMTWKSGNESTVRGYKFTYDGLDRMLNATYGETAGISTNANRFSENVTGYDKNGNIKGLQRYGQLSSAAYGMIDNLTLTLNGNQLNRVDDAVAASTYNGGFEFKNGANAADEYSYDANGNLTKDLNKGISGITYNFLNLPNVVTFSDGSTITYTYGADGTKLRTVHKIGSTTTTTDYCGNVVYENGVQKLLLTEEGYVTLSDSKYHYYLKDHQGNNRVVISQSGTVEETNHYYPFGGAFASTSNVQPYKYNGKELDSKKGLNWYDYGARHYDAALGRFTTNDRFAEKYHSMSPYQYGANNPVKHIDVKGDSIIDINGKAITYQNNEWSSNATPDVKRVGNAMMRNSIGQTQFEKMMWSDYPITITLSSKDDNNSGRIGVTSITGDENGNITKAKITLYMEIIKDIANIIPYAKQGEIVKRYRENLNIDQLSNITLDDVIGATGTHESVHALDKYSNHVGQPDKSKREQNPILKEIEYIKKIKH